MQHIAHVDIAPGSATIPTKHGVDSFLKLDTVRFVDAARVHPKIVQAILSSTIGRECKLGVAVSVPTPVPLKISIRVASSVASYHLCDNIAYGGISR
jgi:hypothetical protein